MIAGNLTQAVANTNVAAAVQIASHAGIGCLSAVASGGKCGPGALSAGVSAAADPFTPNDLAGGTIAHGLIGGLASVAGGGKFANGAITGAFGYLFNDAMHDWARAGTAVGAVGGAGLGGAAAVAGEGACISVTAGGCAVLAPAAPGAIAGGMATGGVVGGYVGNKVGGFLGSVYDWLSGVSYNESAPTETPTGTRPIDKWGIPRGDIHDIKEGIGAVPADWVGVTPGGEVITTGPNGEPVNNGHVDDYTNRPLKQFPRGD